MSHNLEETTIFGFHGCLEAEAFQTVLEQTNVVYTKQIMEDMIEQNIDNPERFEEIFTIKADQEISLISFDIFNGEFDDLELAHLINTPRRRIAS